MWLFWSEQVGNELAASSYSVQCSHPFAALFTSQPRALLDYREHRMLHYSPRWPLSLRLGFPYNLSPFPCLIFTHVPRLSAFLLKPCWQQCCFDSNCTEKVLQTAKHFQSSNGLIMSVHRDYICLCRASWSLQELLVLLGISLIMLSALLP